MSDGIWSEWIANNGADNPIPVGATYEIKNSHGDVVPGNLVTNVRWRIKGDGHDIIAYRYRIDDNTMTPEEAELPADEHNPANRSKYHREIAPGVWVDVYDVLDAWAVNNPALQHLIKKALQPGERGHKTKAQDMDDIVVSAIRARELEQ